jgi:Protein kinase domain
LVDPESSPVALSSERSMGLAASIVDERYRLGAVMAVSRDVVVYAADDTSADRQVALEILRDEVAADADFVAAVWEQARKLASPACAHRAIARVYDTGVTDTGVLFVAVERVVGRTLREVLDARGPLDPYNALRIAIQVGEALEVLHHRGVIHGELRPESVILVRGEGVSEQAKLVGVELMAGHRTAIGVRRRDPTLLAHLAPEQIERAQTTEAADVHALGRLLHDLLTAEPSRESRSPRPYSPVVPATIENIIASALHERPEERYSDITLMLNDMWGAQNEFEAPKPRPRVAQRATLPQVEWPRIRLPRVQLPRVQWPHVRLPRVQWPRVGRRELSMAGIGVGGMALAAVVWVTASHGLPNLRFRVPAPAFTAAPVERQPALPSPSTLPAGPALVPAQPAPPAETHTPAPPRVEPPAPTARVETPPLPEPRRPAPSVPSEAAAPKHVDVGKAIEPTAPPKRVDVPKAAELSTPKRADEPKRPEDLTAAGARRPSEARAPATPRLPASGDQSATDGDGAAIIDWLVKGRR